MPGFLHQWRDEVLSRGGPSRSASGGRVLVVAATLMEARAFVHGLGASVVEPIGADGADGARGWALVGVEWSSASRQGAGVWSLVVSGVGKVNAASAVVHAVALARAGEGTRRAASSGGGGGGGGGESPGPIVAVLNVGIAGALAGANPLALGDAVCASACIYADEGVRTPDGFTDLGAMGFPAGAWGRAGADASRVPVDEAGVALFARVCTHTGPIATVSTCSGTDELAREIAGRTGSLAEAMEGAAAAHAAFVLGLPFVELRVISNTTGDRARQRWDLARAMRGLEALGASLG
jgi:futalosine hydrolase